MGVSRETAALAALLAAGTTAALAAYFYLLRSNKAVSQSEVQQMSCPSFFSLFSLKAVTTDYKILNIKECSEAEFR
jgi:hypothetical protein